MLTLSLSLLSITVGVIIKNLVDLLTKSNKNAVVNKLGKLGGFVFSSLGTICATAFRLVLQVIIFVI